MNLNLSFAIYTCACFLNRLLAAIDCFRFVPRSSHDRKLDFNGPVGGGLLEHFRDLNRWSKGYVNIPFFPLFAPIVPCNTIICAADLSGMARKTFSGFILLSVHSVCAAIFVMCPVDWIVEAVWAFLLTLCRTPVVCPSSANCERLSLKVHAASFRNLESAMGVVAKRALPLAHCFNAAICSAISFDNGAKSFNTWAMDKSDGWVFSSNAW